MGSNPTSGFVFIGGETVTFSAPMLIDRLYVGRVVTRARLPG